MRITSALLPLLLACFLAPPKLDAAHFKVGYGVKDISPQGQLPMWGYGGQRSKVLSVGVRDPLFAKAVVIDVGEDKLALVGLDLGRSPTDASMARIREAVQAQSGVGTVMLIGSHTHHGPVIELLDEPGRGQGKYDAAVKYVAEMEQGIIGAIGQAAATAVDAKMGWAMKTVPLNRNRHTKIEPKPVDQQLVVLRFDDQQDKPIAVIVNFAAHPTMLSQRILQFSSEYPGQMTAAVEQSIGAGCVFLQGAAGDLSANPQGEGTIEAFGQQLAEQVIELAGNIETAVPETPRIQAIEHDYAFDMRLDMSNPLLLAQLKLAFFPELVEAFSVELTENQIRPHVTTVLLNEQVALVGASGEFFCSHSIRLKQRSRAALTLFLGYCNGHHMYFPTIEAAAEGGYGGDPRVSWVPVGSPEQMINQALVDIYTMMGKIRPTTRKKPDDSAKAGGR